MIVYIAGPITGHDDYKERFAEMAARIELEGHIALNPAILPDNMPPTCYMPICIAMLEQADAIFLLDGWDQSPGAIAEMLYAERQGKAIVSFSGEARNEFKAS